MNINNPLTLLWWRAGLNDYWTELYYLQSESNLLPLSAAADGADTFIADIFG